MLYKKCCIKGKSTSCNSSPVRICRWTKINVKTRWQGLITSQHNSGLFVSNEQEGETKFSSKGSAFLKTSWQRPFHENADCWFCG